MWQLRLWQNSRTQIMTTQKLKLWQNFKKIKLWKKLEIWQISIYEDKNKFKGSFSKNIVTPKQPMRCSLGSVLWSLRCLFWTKGWLNELIHEWRRCLLNRPGYTRSVKMVNWGNNYYFRPNSSCSRSHSGASVGAGPSGCSSPVGVSPGWDSEGGGHAAPLLQDPQCSNIPHSLTGGKLFKSNFTTMEEGAPEYIHCDRKQYQSCFLSKSRVIQEQNRNQTSVTLRKYFSDTQLYQSDTRVIIILD